MVADDYDFICIDTPPSLGLLTVNALTASDKVIVPVQCEYLSMRGLLQLQNTLEMIRENLNPRVEIEGILPTMLDSRTVHAKEAVEILEENFGDLVFKSRIKKAIKFAEAPVRGASRAQVRSEEQRRRLLPRAGRGGSDQWRVVSGPACARARSPTSSAPPSIPTIRPRRRPGPTVRPRTRPGSCRAAERPRRATRARAGAPPLEPEARGASREPFDQADPRAASGPAEPVRAYRAEEPPAAKERLSPDLRRRRRSTLDGPDATAARSPATAATHRDAEPHAPVIRVVGVGGAGVNAINRMVEAGIPGVEFMAVNTDLQSLQQSNADVTVHLGSGMQPAASAPAPTPSSATAPRSRSRTRSSACSRAPTWSSSPAAPAAAPAPARRR